MFSDEPDRQEQINAIENRLARWKPAATAIDRDRLLFESGRAAGRAEARSHTILASIACSLLTIVIAKGTIVRDRARNAAAEPLREESVAIEAESRATKNSELSAIDPAWNSNPNVSDDSYLALSRLAESNTFETARRPDSDEPSIRSKPSDNASPPTLNALSSPLDLKDL
jgi:hypothetical protein